MEIKTSTQIATGNGSEVRLEHIMSDNSVWRSDMDGAGWVKVIPSTEELNRYKP